jgi:hypothetical protein
MDYWKTPIHAGAMTPAQLAHRAAQHAAAVLVTAAIVALFAVLFLLTN